MHRWVELLGLIASQSTWGTREIAAAATIPKSVAQRMLREMASEGLLVETERTGEYCVGPSLVRLASLVMANLDVIRLARPILEQVHESTGETVLLGLYARNRRQFWAADKIESDHPVRFVASYLSDWCDVHHGSSGKAILAELPEAEREAIIDALPDPIPGLKPIGKATLRRQLVEARRRGFVVSRGERIAGGVSASAAIRDAQGDVVGDIIISWPDNRTSRDREEKLGQVAHDAAHLVSARLGFAPAHSSPAGAAPHQR